MKPFSFAALSLLLLSSVTRAAAAAEDAPEPSTPATVASEPVEATPEEETPVSPEERATPRPDVTALDDADTLQQLSLVELLNLTIPEITTASRRKESVQDAPAVVLVITANDIRARGYSNVVDVLRDLPGIEINEYYSAQEGTLVTVRGIPGNNKIVVLLNGARVNPPGGEPMMIRHDFSIREAKQVEIMYGPGSTLYGQDSISATINVITEDAGEGTQASLGAMGAYPVGGSGWASYSGTTGDLQLATYAQYSRASLWDLKDLDKKRYRLHLDTAEALGTDKKMSRWDNGLNAFAKASTENTYMQVWYRRSSLSSSEGSGREWSRSPDAKWGDSSIVAEAHHSLKPQPWLLLESQLLFNRFQLDRDSRFIYPTDTNTAWYNNGWVYGEGTSAGLEEKAGFHAGGEVYDLNVVAGVAGKISNVTPLARVPLGPTFLDDVLSGDNGNLLDTYVSYDLDQDNDQSLQRVSFVHHQSFRNLGAYLESNLLLFSKLRLITGARVDYDSRISNLPFSLRAVAGYAFTEDFTAKLILSQAYVAPPASYSERVWEDQRSVTIPNPDLEAERALSSELNLFYKGDNIVLSGSGFLNQQDNLLIPSDAFLPVNIQGNVYVGPVGNQREKALLIATNAGRSISYGGDLYARYSVGDFHGWGSYSYVDVKQKRGEVHTGLARVSRHNVRLGTTYVPLSGLSVTPSLVLRSTPEGFEDAPGTLPYYVKQREWPWEANLNVLYAPTSHLDIVVTVRNLTNNKYALAALRSEDTADAMVKEGISLWTGVQYSFE